MATEAAYEKELQELCLTHLEEHQLASTYTHELVFSRVCICCGVVRVQPDMRMCRDGIVRDWSKPPTLSRAHCNPCWDRWLRFWKHDKGYAKKRRAHKRLIGKHPLLNKFLRDF